MNIDHRATRALTGDDEESVRTSAERLSQDVGYDVAVASNGLDEAFVDKRVAIKLLLHRVSLLLLGSARGPGTAMW